MAAAVMNKVNQRIHFPKKFREMIACKEVDAAVLLQIYIDRVCYFSFFSTLGRGSLLHQLHSIHEGMVKYQINGKDPVDMTLWDISEKHLKTLMSLSKQEYLSVNQKKRISGKILEEWETEAGPLISYPREIIFKGGKKINISFDYFLACLGCKVSIAKDLKHFMNLTCKIKEDETEN